MKKREKKIEVYRFKICASNQYFTRTEIFDKSFCVKSASSCNIHLWLANTFTVNHNNVKKRRKQNDYYSREVFLLDENWEEHINLLYFIFNAMNLVRCSNFSLNYYKENVSNYSTFQWNLFACSKMIVQATLWSPNRKTCLNFNLLSISLDQIHFDESTVSYNTKKGKKRLN